MQSKKYGGLRFGMAEIRNTERLSSITNIFLNFYQLLLNVVQSNYCKHVCLFYAKFSLDNFDFLSDFYALDFLHFA